MTHPRSAGGALQLKDLVKTYGGSTVVDGVSLDVSPGEFVTLLGPSGSGKTTTLNMIAGFTDVTSGGIAMDGRPIARLKPHQRDIGVVFQHYALFPHMSVGANVAFPLKQRGVSRADTHSKVQEALHLVRLEGMADRYPRQLSGGQQQRVALARALVFDPRILLMDEPLGALDKKLRESLQIEIKRIHREVGISFVYVTHDQEEALALSDRIVVFNNGRIEQIGTAEELYERPRTHFVADFIGESNCIHGKYVRDPAHNRLASGSMTFPAPPHSELADGEAATLVIRPENLKVVAKEAAGDVNTALYGEISEILHLGGSRRIEIRLADRSALFLREQASRRAPLSIGDTVCLHYDVEQAVLLPEEVVTQP